MEKGDALIPFGACAAAAPSPPDWGAAMEKSQPGTAAQRELQQAMAAVEIQFVADVQAMVFHRFGADPQGRGNFLAGLILGDEFQDAPLGRG